MEGKLLIKHEKSGSDIHFNVAPAGGTEFDFDRSSPASTSSAHSVSDGTMDDTSSFRKWSRSSKLLYTSVCNKGFYQSQ